MVVGCTPDIPEYLNYHWNETIWYYDQEAQFPEEGHKLGKWLGVVHRVGQALLLLHPVIIWQAFHMFHYPIITKR